MINEYFYTTDSKTSASHFAKHKDEFLLVEISSFFILVLCFKICIFE